jgi:putative sigma-54 modulation protein
LDVHLQSKDFQLPERLSEVTLTKVSKAARFFEGIASADVELSRAHNPRVPDPFTAEITSRAAGHTVRVEANGPTPEIAIDAAVEKFEIRLQRLKERLIDRTRKGGDKRLNFATEGVEEETSEPLIVRVKQFVMKPMTPEEAALQMDTLGHGFFFFQNAESDMPSVLYRRRDGSFGLIEPA